MPEIPDFLSDAGMGSRLNFRDLLTRQSGLLIAGLVLTCWGSPNRLFHSHWAALVGLAPLFVYCEHRSLRQQALALFGVWFCFCAFVFLPDPFSSKALQVSDIIGGIAVAPFVPLFYVVATFLTTNVTKWVPRVWRPLAMATVWTGLDCLLGVIWFPIPFHWGSLLFDWPVGIQIAEVTGIWGVTFFAVWINAALAVVWLCWPSWGKTWAVIGSTTVATGLVVGYGVLRLTMVEATLEPLRLERYYVVGALQQMAWLETDRSWPYRAERYQDLQRLSRSALIRGARLVVWSEGALRAQFVGTRLEPYILNSMRAVMPTESRLVIGATDPDPMTRELPLEQQKFINSALLYNEEGTLLDQYGKQWLFPYFETARYVSSPGGYVPLESGSNSMGQLGLMICLESVLPGPSRQLVLNGAQSLITIADDSWFGNSNWPMLHGNLSVFRAVENRRSFVFTNNTGGNMVVDPTGQIQTSAPIFEQDAVVGSVAIRDDLTIYTRFGDWFSWIMIAGLGGLLLAQTRYYSRDWSHGAVINIIEEK